MGFRSRRRLRKNKAKGKKPYGLNCTSMIEDELAAMNVHPSSILGPGLPERGESKPLATAAEYIPAGSAVRIELGEPDNAFVYAAREAAPLPLQLSGLALEVSPVRSGEVIIARGHEDPDSPAIRRASQRWGTDVNIVPGGGEDDL